MMSLNLQELNEKNILPHEREFLFRLHKRKHSKNNSRKGKSSYQGSRVTENSNHFNQIRPLNEDVGNYIKTGKLSQNGHRVLKTNSNFGAFQ